MIFRAKKVLEDVAEEDPEDESDSGISYIKWKSAKGKDVEHTEFTHAADNFLKASKKDPWDKPIRCVNDPWPLIADNRWESIRPEEAEDFLPQKRTSVEFRTEVEWYKPPRNIKMKKRNVPRCSVPTGVATKEYRRLDWLSGEVLDDVHGNLVFNCGGPVLSLSWHPSGKLLAVSIGNDLHEDIDYKFKDVNRRKSSVQIFSHQYVKPKNLTDEDQKPIVNRLSLKSIICSDYGYATNLQWCSFWPELFDTFRDQEASFPSNTVGRIGYLAASYEDGTIRVYSMTTNDLHDFASLESEHGVQLTM
jgi:WD40 repeat protein